MCDRRNENKRRTNYVFFTRGPFCRGAGPSGSGCPILAGFLRGVAGHTDRPRNYNQHPRPSQSCPSNIRRFVCCGSTGLARFCSLHRVRQTTRSTRSLLRRCSSWVATADKNGLPNHLTSELVYPLDRDTSTPEGPKRLHICRTGSIY